MVYMSDSQMWLKLSKTVYTTCVKDPDEPESDRTDVAMFSPLPGLVSEQES